jgi:nicotinamide mononucleotide (NMN) deamidase PncC
MELFDKNLLIRIGKYLKRKEETLAVAESVTAGLVQYAFSNVPDATQFFQGGLTAYNVAQKFKHLQVEPIHALAVNCVSQLVAEQMALQVCSLGPTGALALQVMPHLYRNRAINCLLTSLLHIKKKYG